MQHKKEMVQKCYPYDVDPLVTCSVCETFLRYSYGLGLYGDVWRSFNTNAEAINTYTTGK